MAVVFGHKYCHDASRLGFYALNEYANVRDYLNGGDDSHFDLLVLGYTKRELCHFSPE